MAEIASRTDYGSFKDQWARYVARQSLARQTKAVKVGLANLAENDPNMLEAITGKEIPADFFKDDETLLRHIALESDRLEFGRLPPKPGHFRMGIVGSGVSGLFTGLLLDFINERFKGTIHVDYEILEASGPERLGGRLYTHRFTKDPHEHQYYDVGAMRFPNNPAMKRTFQLFEYLGMSWEGKDPALRRYYYTDDNGVCPSYYNEKRVWGRPKWHDLVHPDELGPGKKEFDPFGINFEFLPDDPRRIPSSVIQHDPGDLLDAATKPFVERLQKEMIQAQALSQSGEYKREESAKSDGWKYLMTADFMSVRQFLRSEHIKELDMPGCNYNFNTIEWFETYSLGTGWFDQALAEQILEAIDFITPEPEYPDGDKTKEPKDWYWYCVEGGTQLIAERMAKRLKNKPEFHKQVTVIAQDLLKSRSHEPGTGDIELKIMTNDGPNKGKQETRSYFTVFNTTALGPLQRMDLSKAGLLYGTKQAIRSLRYGASCKVGIRFKEMWWMKEPWNIKRGGIGHTDLPLRACVYPSYNIGDDVNKPGVLLCSYSWAQDAQRLGTLIDPSKPKEGEQLKDLMLSNLAYLHAKPDKGWTYDKLLAHLHSLYLEQHAIDWYNEPNMAGAFAYFGPGQFSQMWPEIIKPSGWLFLVGEAASSNHGWIAGAVGSAVRATYQLFQKLEDQHLKSGKADFKGYREVMNFLAGPNDSQDEDWKLPFVGLPREIPVHQLNSDRDKGVQFAPEKKDVDLSFITAQSIVSFLQLGLQLAEEAKQSQFKTTA